MCKKTLQQCKTGNDFIGYASHNGASIRSGKGSHQIIEYKGHICPVSVHPGELPTGTRHSIIKMLVLIGLGILFLIVIITIL